MKSEIHLESPARTSQGTLRLKIKSLLFQEITDFYFRSWANHKHSVWARILLLNPV
jgi:hypothetical protein